MPRAWRLLRDGPASGAWNMAVDEALLESALGGAAPALRLYAWDGPWLSLGYAQALDPALGAACRAAGVGLVRRVTGGRAVLHGADLTYAVAAPEGVLPSGLRDAYRRITDALLVALLRIGVSAQRVAPHARAAGEAGFDCFAEPAPDEICVGWRKLAGNAQRRAAGGVLQHGSLRLCPDAPDAARAARLAPERATSLSECGYRGGEDALHDAIARAFGEVFRARLEPCALDAAERARARERCRARARDPLARPAPPSALSRATSRDPQDRR